MCSDQEEQRGACRAEIRRKEGDLRRWTDAQLSAGLTAVQEISASLPQAKNKKKKKVG